MQAYHELVAENKKLKEKYEMEIKSMEQRCDNLKSELLSSHEAALSDASKLHEQQMMKAIQEAENHLGKIKNVCRFINLFAVSLSKQKLMSW
jgi:aspartate/tyrosine/aromatic aminotransferase